MKIREIQWIDSESFYGWHNEDSVKNASHKKSVITSIGYVVEETDEYILLAQSLVGDQRQNTVKIPKASIAPILANFSWASIPVITKRVEDVVRSVPPIKMIVIVFLLAVISIIATFKHYHIGFRYVSSPYSKYCYVKGSEPDFKEKVYYKSLFTCGKELHL